MTTDERIIHIKVLREEVEVLTKRLKPAGTGHLHTAIGVINSRIDELIKNGMIDKSISMKEKYGRAVETINVGLEELG
jgi:hypothetical protein